MQNQLSIYKCRICGEHLPQGRSDQIFCGNTCRSKNHRYKQRLQRAVNQINENLILIAAYAENPDWNGSAIDALKAVFKAENEACRKMRVVRVKGE